MENLEMMVADYVLKHGDMVAKDLDERKVEALVEHERTFQSSYEEDRMRQLWSTLAGALNVPYSDVASICTRGFLQKVTGKDIL